MSAPDDAPPAANTTSPLLDPRLIRAAVERARRRARTDHAVRA